MLRKYKPKSVPNSYDHIPIILYDFLQVLYSSTLLNAIICYQQIANVNAFCLL